jgi:ABC-type multidrug transport system ATPase subunit
VNLTKRYAKYTAVNDVSFEVGRGEIVGLLGPNGAGKSTILRILSCFIPATNGTVRVGGTMSSFRPMSPATDRLHARKTIRCTWKCACANI